MTRQQNVSLPKRKLMRHSILTPIFLLALFAARDAHANTVCPPPSVAQGGQCVLTGDATLSDTMWLTTGTTLNCLGHRLTPMTGGTNDDPRTLTNEFQPSRPELAIFVHAAYNVKIENCHISGFDFGIIVAQSKTANTPPGLILTQKLIFGNTIDVRTNAIDVIKSDGVIVSGNQLTYASERGRGVVLNYDSDQNQIIGNTITSTDAASTGQVRVLPGGALVTTTAIMDNTIHCLESDNPIENFVVSGVLFQVRANEPGTDFENTGRSDHNLIAANNISHLGSGTSCTLDPGTSCTTDADCPGKGACLLKANSGVAFNGRASDTTVFANRFSGHMDRGVSIGGIGNPVTIAGWVTGTCSLDATRMCSANSDCNIPGYDTISKGVCNGAAPATFDGTTQRLTATANSFSGVYDSAALFANNTGNFTFSGNFVNGGASGIRIEAGAIDGLIERNIVSGAANALHLGPQTPFTQLIQLNDFTGYSAAIRTSNTFTNAADISAAKGNYWGLPCPGFAPSLVLFESGAINPFVTDAHPYGKPVALTPNFLLPATCK
jgi:hypothetical protein